MRLQTSSQCQNYFRKTYCIDVRAYNDTDNDALNGRVDVHLPYSAHLFPYSQRTFASQFHTVLSPFRGRAESKSGASENQIRSSARWTASGLGAANLISALRGQWDTGRGQASNKIPANVNAMPTALARLQLWLTSAMPTKNRMMMRELSTAMA